MDDVLDSVCDIYDGRDDHRYASLLVSQLILLDVFIMLNTFLFKKCYKLQNLFYSDIILWSSLSPSLLLMIIHLSLLLLH